MGLDAFDTPQMPTYRALTLEGPYGRMVRRVMKFSLASPRRRGWGEDGWGENGANAVDLDWVMVSVCFAEPLDEPTLLIKGSDANRTDRRWPLPPFCLAAEPKRGVLHPCTLAALALHTAPYFRILFVLPGSYLSLRVERHEPDAILRLSASASFRAVRIRLRRALLYARLAQLHTPICFVFAAVGRSLVARDVHRYQHRLRGKRLIRTYYPGLYAAGYRLHDAQIRRDAQGREGARATAFRIAAAPFVPPATIRRRWWTPVPAARAHAAGAAAAELRGVEFAECANLVSQQTQTQAQPETPPWLGHGQCTPPSRGGGGDAAAGRAAVVCGLGKDLEGGVCSPGQYQPSMTPTPQGEWRSGQRAISSRIARSPIDVSPASRPPDVFTLDTDQRLLLSVVLFSANHPRVLVSFVIGCGSFDRGRSSLTLPVRIPRAALSHWSAPGVHRYQYRLYGEQLEQAVLPGAVRRSAQDTLALVAAPHLRGREEKDARGKDLWPSVRSSSRRALTTSQGLTVAVMICTLSWMARAHPPRHSSPKSSYVARARLASLRTPIGLRLRYWRDAFSPRILVNVVQHALFFDDLARTKTYTTRAGASLLSAMGGARWSSEAPPPAFSTPRHLTLRPRRDLSDNPPPRQVDIRTCDLPHIRPPPLLVWCPCRHS
ncbi:hypothetical protein C8R47DRAFT_1297894 [Mycena vitilis]|nr:hypothetical protein C8R47DRAFT_1297894 [Mycena vitilis]